MENVTGQIIFFWKKEGVIKITRTEDEWEDDKLCILHIDESDAHLNKWGRSVTFHSVYLKTEWVACAAWNHVILLS